MKEGWFPWERAQVSVYSARATLKKRKLNVNDILLFKANYMQKEDLNRI